MGAAIPVMHYTGMAAAHFTRNLERPDYGNSVSISDLGVFGIAFVTLIVLVTALVTSAVDRRFGHQAIELENSERRYRQLVDVAQVILWRRDVVTSEFDLVSGEAERLLGYPTRLWLEDPDFWMDHVHPEDRPYVSACWQKAARQGCHLPFEYRMVAADGRIVWLRASIGAVDIPSERSRLVAAMLDITGLKQAEQSLREQKHLLESLITTVPDSIYFKDLESRFVLINRAQAKLLGLPNCEDALGKSDADFFDETHAAKARIDEQKIMQTGIGMVEEEERELWPDGRVTWASTTKMPLIDMKGAMIGTLGMSKNITSRKRAEQWLDERSAELLAMNRRLQQEISERLLLESQLVQAQKLESIGQLAAGIAHELNTPIQYIGDNIRFLRDAFSSMTRVLSVQPKLTAELERLNVAPELVSLVSTVAGEADLDYLFEEVPRAIDQCAQGVQSVATIVMAMKEFSHPGKAEQATIDINHAIENTLVVCRNEWKYVADATTDLDPGLPAVRCFPGEFNQVILNLVVNAAHAVASAAREGREKGIIAVSTRSAGPFVEICIKDNGIGISAAAQPRIFTPFFTTKEIGKGTGQGLALARSVIVKKHKGTITFESEENVGTTFIVCLPIAGIGNDEVS
jgi:PAS domain S-box-containing protein